MSEINTNNKKFEIVAKYIKDISFEIPTPDSFVDAAQNLGSYSTKLDINSNPYKNNLVELTCKFKLEAPENIKNKIPIRKNGKVIRLTESDLRRIVKRVMNEGVLREDDSDEGVKYGVKGGLLKIKKNDNYVIS